LGSATQSTNDDGYGGRVPANTGGPQPREARCPLKSEEPTNPVDPQPCQEAVELAVVYVRTKSGSSNDQDTVRSLSGSLVVVGSREKCWYCSSSVVGGNGD